MMQSECYKVWFEEMPDGLIAYPYDLQRVNEYRVMDGEYIADWPPNVTLLAKGGQPRDYLFCVLTGWVPISRRVQQVFERYGIGDVQFLPVRVKHEIGGELTGYALINVLKLISALDREHTVWATKEKDQVEYPQLNILRVALCRTRITGLDIFRLKESPTTIYISRRLKEALEHEGTTVGFKFKPVPVY